MFRTICNFIGNLFTPSPIRLTIVRRYCDANGNYVGELYMDQTIKRRHDALVGYTMIGVSLDSLPIDVSLPDGVSLRPRDDFELDTDNDFLTHMPRLAVRVGAIDPKDNDEVRRLVAKLPRRNMTLVIQNKFIEHVMDKKPC